MSVALKLPEMVEVPANVMEATIKKMEQDAHIIRALKTKNERLKEEKLEAELEASTAIAQAKFAQAQAWQRVRQLEEKVDAMAQILAGDFKLMQESVSYLMGNTKV